MNTTFEERVLAEHYRQCFVDYIGARNQYLNDLPPELRLITASRWRNQSEEWMDDAEQREQERVANARRAK